MQRKYHQILLYNANQDTPRKVMIYLGDENSRQNGCSSVEECLFICNLEPSRCKSPESSSLRKDGGIWSTDENNNPFSKYFKVSLIAALLVYIYHVILSHVS